MNKNEDRLTTHSVPNNNHGQIWQHYIERARSKVADTNWDSACIAYKQTFSLAEQLICHNCPSQQSHYCSLKRYVNTAEEYAFVMRKNHFDCALSLFVQQVKANLEQYCSPALVIELTQRLMNCSSLSEQDLDSFYDLAITRN